MREPCLLLEEMFLIYLTWWGWILSIMGQLIIMTDPSLMGASEATWCSRSWRGRGLPRIGKIPERSPADLGCRFTRPRLLLGGS
jgi:hypothetical protein